MKKHEVISGTRVDLAQSIIAMAVRAGAPLTTAVGVKHRRLEAVLHRSLSMTAQSRSTRKIAAGAGDGYRELSVTAQKGGCEEHPTLEVPEQQPISTIRRLTNRLPLRTVRIAVKSSDPATILSRLRQAELTWNQRGYTTALQ